MTKCEEKVTEHQFHQDIQDMLVVGGLKMQQQ
jgi:hypothetical protein